VRNHFLESCHIKQKAFYSSLGHSSILVQYSRPVFQSSPPSLGCALYAYTWVVPAVLSGLLWWRGNNHRHSLLELLSVYGYSIGIFIPITVGSEDLSSTGIPWRVWVLFHRCYGWLTVMCWGGRCWLLELPSQV